MKNTTTRSRIAQFLVGTIGLAVREAKAIAAYIGLTEANELMRGKGEHRSHRNGGTRTGVAAAKRAARKRRNIVARSAKK